MDTPTFAISIAQLNQLKPSPASGREVRAQLRGLDADKARRYTAADARTAGVSFKRIVWAATALARKDKAVERRLRLWKADCAAHVLHIFEREHPTDMRPRDAIRVARAFANGEVDAATWAAARVAAWNAAWAAVRAAEWGASLAAAWAAGRAPEWEATWAAAGVAAGEAEEQWQFDRLIAWLSDNEPAPLDLPDLIREAA